MKFREFKYGEKKKAILDLFNSIDWIEAAHGVYYKIITKEHFAKIGLYVSAGPGENQANCNYVASILRGMGHSVRIGQAMYVHRDRSVNHGVLDQREIKLLYEVAHGMTTKQIHSETRVSINLIEHMRKTIMTKLNALNMPHAVHRAHQLGIIK